MGLSCFIHKVALFVWVLLLRGGVTNQQDNEKEAGRIHSDVKAKCGQCSLHLLHLRPNEEQDRLGFSGSSRNYGTNYMNKL